MRQQLNQAISVLVSISLLVSDTVVAASNPNTSTRLDWNMVETNTSVSGIPSNVKYFQYYDTLPDEIVQPIYKNMNLTTIAGKKLFVGYGTIDPDGTSCRYFPELGRSECLPWWRIEREYSIPDANTSSAIDFLKNLTLIYPPKNIQYCREWKTLEQLDGGKVTCTSYYDKRKSVDCLANPMQSACYVDQCSNGIKTGCTLVGSVEGETTTLVRPVVGSDGLPVGAEMIVGLKTHQYTCPSGYLPGKECADTLYASTYPYECKAPTSVAARDGEYAYCDTNPRPFYDNTGALVGFTSDDKCSNGQKIDGAIDANNKLRICQVNSYSQTQKVCDDPITQTVSSVASQTIKQKRTYKDYETSVLFGDEVGDIYAGDKSCLRLNDVEGARAKTITTHIVGSGNLDDDIYVLAHKANGSYNKIYCNMQHNEASSGTAKKWTYQFSGYATSGTKTITATLKMDTGEISTVSKNVQAMTSGGLNNGSVDISAAGSPSVNINTSFVVSFYSASAIVSVTLALGDGTQATASLESTTTSFVNKNYAGDTLQCIDNNGNYSFDQNIQIAATDIVSIQQASEFENATKISMFARNHYGSTAVNIDGVLAAPATSGTDYPLYPQVPNCHNMSCLKTWDNAISTASIMFPFAGAYEIYVYGGSVEGENKLLGSATISMDDFKSIPLRGYMQLKLGKSMALSTSISDGDTSNACREDDFTEWGGGVYGTTSGSKGNMSSCVSPDDTYVKANSAYNIVIKDLLTGAITPIHLVYPLPYPNRIFISKLNIVENRKYRCYDDFPDIGMSAGCVIGSQNETQPISDYRGMSVNLNRDSTLYCDVTTQKVVGCNSERTVQRSGGFSYNLPQDSYDTKDNSGMFMNALAGAQLSEQMMHIWSGWRGECESGIFTDFSWTSDPMSLASLALSAYGSATYGADKLSSASTGIAEASSETASAFNDAIEAGMSVDEIVASGTSDIAQYAKFVQDANYWSDALGTSLVNMVNETASTVTDGFNNMVNQAIGDVNNIVGGIGDTGVLSDIASHYNDALDTANKIYNNTVNVGESLSTLEKNLHVLGDALANTTDPSTIDSLNKAINETVIEYADLQATLSGTVYTTISNTATDVSNSIKGLFSDPKNIEAANLSAYNTEIDAYMRGQVDTVKSFYAKFQEINTIKDIGFTTIKWSDFAYAGYQMYANVKAQQDEMIKAWNAQKAYVLSGQGTQNDIAANAYSSCMASVGAGFINTVSIANGANDTNTTSAELLRPERNPLRISFQSLYELKSIVGEKFLETSYMIKDVDYNMQMLTIVALNSGAYTQLTQEMCGGYQVASLANALNYKASGSNPNMIDALANMSPEQAAKMAASMACAFAGAYAFACSLGLKVLSSFSSGNACTDEKIAQSQKPIQLKTNKFQKFGQCHYIEETCSKKLPVTKKCILKKRHYCCYDQVMTRIFAEGVKAQRGTKWNTCNDITINDLKDISFTPCILGQDPHRDRCFPLDKYNELNGELRKQIKKGFAADGDTFMSQIKNAMEISN